MLILARKQKRDKELRSYPSKYPSKVPFSLSDNEWRKQRTLELYSYLPQTSLEDRFKYVDIRDEVIFLNYKFFGYVASTSYVKSCNVSYEDKLQSALSNFCTMWHKYMYAERYRTDLAFSVFFKPRLSECIYRELRTVKHTTNRTLKMKAAEQLGIHYSKLHYEDLAKVDLPEKDMEAIKAIFNADDEVAMETAELFLPATGDVAVYDDDLYTDEYDDIEHVIMNEMVEKERMLTVADLMEISDTLGLDIKELEKAQPKAEQMLYNELRSAVDCKDMFNDGF